MTDRTKREEEALRMLDVLTKDLRAANDLIRTLMILRWSTFAIVFLSGAFCGVVLYIGSR